MMKNIEDVVVVWTLCSIIIFSYQDDSKANLHPKWIKLPSLVMNAKDISTATTAAAAAATSLFATKQKQKK